MAGQVLRYRLGRSARPSGVFLGLVALWIAGGVVLWLGVGPVALGIFVFVVAGWLVSLALHEYSHARVAFAAGDHSVVERGYLTLNPLKYTHPLLSIVLPVVVILMGGFGLPGGAVLIDRDAVRNRTAQSLISLAGPAVNVAFTIALVIPFLTGLATFEHLAFWAGVALLAFFQLTVSVINLLPMPGLDGGNLIRPWLTHPWDRRFDLFAPWGLLILLVLLFEPRVNAIFFDAVFFLGDLIGLPTYLVGAGMSLLQFWR